MNHSKIRERYLRQLLEDNFKVARYCRKFSESILDASLKYYFQNVASRHSQFAMEIADEISYYGGKEPYMSSTSYERNRMDHVIDKVAAVRKALRINKESLQLYQKALCEIYEGSCREILLRHKAYIENGIFELKSIKTLMNYVPTPKENFKERAH